MYYQHPYFQTPINRNYPPVDISTFEQSVTDFQKTVVEASTILKKFTNPQFARMLMSAAQSGNKQEVNRLIKSIGTTAPITIRYTPTGLWLTIHSQTPGIQCCELTMFLKWGR